MLIVPFWVSALVDERYFVVKQLIGGLGGLDRCVRNACWCCNDYCTNVGQIVQWTMESCWWQSVVALLPVYALVDEWYCVDAKCLVDAMGGLVRCEQNACLIFVDALRQPNLNGIDEEWLMVRALVE